jgi:6-pyruvoyl tetrahydropterin synthase/QueD family protein
VPSSQVIRVRHNIEMAHRLSLTPGKCENIHGHTWWCTMSLLGDVDETGKVLEFGKVKEEFRSYLDRNYDHRLLLYDRDELMTNTLHPSLHYPGLRMTMFDPTTENVANEIFEWATQLFQLQQVHIELQETPTNWATMGVAL